MAGKTPYAWQLKAKAMAVKEIISLVVDCGCGKTLAAIFIALVKNKPVLIIAPGHRLCAQWRDELNEELGDKADIWLYSRPEETKRGAAYQKEFEQWLLR